MCGCKQGTCPGGCPCGCRHTPPETAAREVVPSEAAVEAAIAAEDWHSPAILNSEGLDSWICDGRDWPLDARGVRITGAMTQTEARAHQMAAALAAALPVEVARWAAPLRELADEWQRHYDEQAPNAPTLIYGDAAMLLRHRLDALPGGEQA